MAYSSIYRFIARPEFSVTTHCQKVFLMELGMGMGRHVARCRDCCRARAEATERRLSAVRDRLCSAVHEMIDGIDCKERPQISLRFLDIGGNVLERTLSVWEP